MSSHNPAWTPPNSLIILAGYGCNTITPSLSGKKQWASFIVDDQAAAASIGKGADYYIHNMLDTATVPLGCSGDSGGPAWLFDGVTYKNAGIAVHGNTGGHTGFARFSNVNWWLLVPGHNIISTGFQGFIFNHDTGRCITPASGGHRESDCDGRNQVNDVQGWRLSNSGAPGAFYLVNAASSKCLDLETTANGSRLVERTCLPITQFANNTQRWLINTSQVDSDYRRIINTTTGRCTEVSGPFEPTSSLLVSKTCSNGTPTWRRQAWIMTR